MAQEKPRIGISGKAEIVNGRMEFSKSVLAMKEYVERTGGEPVLIDHRKPPATKSLDGLIFMGNDFEIDPARYGEKKHPETYIETQFHPNHPKEKDSHAYAQMRKARADYEWQALREAEQLKLPIFGICGGMQRINVGLGGKLIQHIDGLEQSKEELTTGTTTKEISIVPGTHFFRMARRGDLDGKQHTTADGRKLQLQINTYHKQLVAPERLGRGLRVSATSEHRGEALIEAIESAGDWYVMGVQWHPEYIQNHMSEHIFMRFVEDATKYLKRRDNPKHPEARMAALLNAMPDSFAARS